MIFDIWLRNKKTEDELIIKNNKISDTDSLRITYNPKTKNLEGSYLKLINSFKKEINKKFNIKLNNSIIYTSNKELAVYALKKEEYGEYTFESDSGLTGFTIAIPGRLEKDEFNRLWVKTLS